MSPSYSKFTAALKRTAYLASLASVAALAPGTAAANPVDISQLPDVLRVLRIAEGSGGSAGVNTTYGDFNSDGYSDLVIGAPFADTEETGQTPARQQNGAVYVIYGGAGLSPDTVTLTGQNANVLKLFGGQSGDNFGFSLAAGDVDADGREDLMVGSPGALDPGNAAVQTGAVHVFFGDGMAPGAIDLADDPSPEKFTAAATGAAAELGHDVIAADFNQDGVYDLALGAPASQISGAAQGAGSVVILYGPLASSSSPALLDFSGTFSVPVGQSWLIGPSQGARLGDSLTAADVDGDGYPDVAAGAPHALAADEGAVAIFPGSQLLGSGSDPGQVFQFAETTVSNGESLVTGGAADAALGSALAAGDINGDGFGDLLIGTSSDGVSGSFQAAVIWGTENFFGHVIDLAATSPDTPTGFGETRIFSRQLLDSFGAAIAIGDTNSDGYDDIIIGAPGALPEDPLSDSSGKVYVIAGGPDKPGGVSVSGPGTVVVVADDDLPQVFEGGTIAISPDPGSLGVSIGPDDYEAAGFPIQHIGSSILHLPVAFAANANGSALISRNLFGWQGGAQGGLYDFLCASSASVTFPVNAVGTHTFGLQTAADPWQAGQCLSELPGSSAGWTPLTSVQVAAGESTVHVVGPTLWTKPVPFPHSSSDSPVAITIDIGPSQVYSGGAILSHSLCVYDVANPQRQKWFPLGSLQSVANWDGQLFDYLPGSSACAVPALDTSSPGYYISSGGNYGMKLQMCVENTAGNQAQVRTLLFNYEDMASPQQGTALSVYTPFEQ